MKILTYLANKLGGLKIAITDEHKAKLVSYNGYPFETGGSDGGSAIKRIEATATYDNDTRTYTIPYDVYRTLQVGDVLSLTATATGGVRIFTIQVPYYSPTDGFSFFLSNLDYHIISDAKAVFQDGSDYIAISSLHPVSAPFGKSIGLSFTWTSSGTVDFIVPLEDDGNLVKVERCSMPGGQGEMPIVEEELVASKSHFTVRNGADIVFDADGIKWTDNLSSSQQYMFKVTTTTNVLWYFVMFGGNQ